jgi:hypothetical protein
MTILLHFTLALLKSSAAVFVILLPGVVIFNLVIRLFSTASLPDSLPWVGKGDGVELLAQARANFLSFFNLRELLDEGYNKVSQTSTAFALNFTEQFSSIPRMIRLTYYRTFSMVRRWFCPDHKSVGCWTNPTRS